MKFSLTALALLSFSLLACTPGTASAPTASPDPSPAEPIQPSAVKVAAPEPELADRSAEVTALASVEAAPVAPAPAPDILEGIVVAPDSHADTYTRKDWPHWRDEDKDCQDARAEALIEESTEPVGFKNYESCHVIRGHWICPYTGEVFKIAKRLDLDHLVPLRNAHVSGAWAWDRARRQAYANDLSNPWHLVGVKASANRSKGARGPEAWLPELEQCRYVREWAKVKRQWQLSMTEGEAAVVRDVGSRCDDG